jgi:pimeloyl-ACP methyl ester carboxylesterase
LIIVGHDLGVPFATRLAQISSGKKHLVVMNGLTGPQLLARQKNPKQLLKSWYIWTLQIPGASFLIEKWAPKIPFQIANRFKKEKIEFNPRALKAFALYQSLCRDSLKTFRDGKKFDLNLTVIWGKEDAFLERPTKQEFASLSRQPQIYLLNCSHWPQCEQVEKVQYIFSQISQSLQTSAYAEHNPQP